MSHIPKEPRRGWSVLAFDAAAVCRPQVRAARDISFRVFGALRADGSRKPTRPIATGTFAFPAFTHN